MIFDAQNLFSDDQALTTTAVSTNVIDLGVAADVGPGEPLYLRIQVTTAFAGGTSLKVALQKDDNSGFSSATIVLESEVIATASLTQGYLFPLTQIPHSADEQYLRLNYTIVGTMSAGAITAGIVTGHQANTHFAAAP